MEGVMDSKLRQLISWITTHVEAESPWLNNHLVYNVNAHSLLDEISNIFEVSKDEIGSIVESINNK